MLVYLVCLYESSDVFLVYVAHIIYGINKPNKITNLYLKLLYILIFLSYVYNILLENQIRYHMWNCYDPNWDNELRINRPYQFLFQLIFDHCLLFDSEVKWYYMVSDYVNDISLFLFLGCFWRVVLTAFPSFTHFWENEAFNNIWNNHKINYISKSSFVLPDNDFITKICFWDN